MDLTLRRGTKARILRGHPWAFEGELQKPPSFGESGDEARLLDAGGNFVARGFVQPGSSLVFRALTRDPGEALDVAFFERRIRAALALRERELPGEEAVRLVSGEADGLPGLAVDRYGSHLVVQASAAGMDRRTDLLLDALKRVLSPASVLARNDARSRSREGLEAEVRQLHGETPRELSCRVGPVTLAFSPWEGQKTGLYLDQRQAYRLASRFKGLRVLDAFCYVGGWCQAALSAGAREAVGLDSSGPALAFARRNVPRARFEEANAFDFLREASDRGERFGGIVLDPPPFVRAKQDLEKGLKAYKEIALRALRMLEPGGWLVVASCSQRVSAGDLEACLRDAASDARRSVRVSERFGQPPDHPALLEVPETAYLKGLLLEARG